MEIDQGKIFIVFWVFLMDQDWQDWFDEMAVQLFEQLELEAYCNFLVLFCFKVLLVEAGEWVDWMIIWFIEQLCWFLAFCIFLENCCVGQVIEEIE